MTELLTQNLSRLQRRQPSAFARLQALEAQAPSPLAGPTAPPVEGDLLRATTVVYLGVDRGLPRLLESLTGEVNVLVVEPDIGRAAAVLSELECPALTDPERVRWVLSEEILEELDLADFFLGGIKVITAPGRDPGALDLAVMRRVKELFADLDMQGYVFPATGGLIPPGMVGHEPATGLSYDPERARALLAEAGFPDGKRFPAVTILTEQSNEPPGAYLASQWQHSLGVSITWTGVEWDAFVEQLEGRPPAIVLDMWMADYPDPDNFLRVCDAVRWARWKDATFEKLVGQARGATDQGRRMAMYHEAERALMDSAAVVPLVYGRSHLMVAPAIRDYPISAIKWWYWKDAVIEPRT